MVTNQGKKRSLVFTNFLKFSIIHLKNENYGEDLKNMKVQITKTVQKENAIDLRQIKKYHQTIIEQKYSTYFSPISSKQRSETSKRTQNSLLESKIGDKSQELCDSVKRERSRKNLVENFADKVGTILLSKDLTEERISSGPCVIKMRSYQKNEITEPSYLLYNLLEVPEVGLFED